LRLNVDASDLAPFASSEWGKERATRLELLNVLDFDGDPTFWCRCIEMEQRWRQNNRRL